MTPNSYLFDSIPDLLGRQAVRHAGTIAIEAAGSTALSYGELLKRVQGLMRALHGCGISRGSRVAIILPNGIELAVSMLSVASMATAVPLNPVYRRDEYRAYFDEIRVTHLLTLDQFSSEARSVAQEKKIPIIELAAGASMTLAVPGAGVPGEVELAKPQDIALILLTSGSTGRSKKVPLTHRNICVSVGDICRTLELTPSDRCLCMWEQFHVGGLVDLLLVPLAGGGGVICAGGFSAPLFYEVLGRKKPTWFQGVPTTLHDLAVFAGQNSVNPKAGALRFIRSVASSLSPQLMQQIEDLFGVPVIQTFGMTEAGPLITTNNLPPGKRRPGSVGISCGPKIRILSPDGADLPAGSIGEIVIQGDNVVAGYEDAPEANARSFRDGWFHTGDTGYLDAEGFLYLTGRLKEMINRGGEKITPQEVDDILLRHPEVAQAASFSIKHPTLGEDVGAAVVLRNPGAATESELRGFVMQHLADFKVPKKILFLDQMPRDPIGKISRMSLAVLAEAQRPAGGAGERVVPAAKPGDSQPEEMSDKARRLLAVWRAVLEKPALGVDDDFFLAGGDSLTAITLFTQMEQAFGAMPPMTSLLEYPTARRMADRLEFLKASHGTQAILPLRATGRRPPLIMCHAAHSNVLFLRRMLPVLEDEQPLYAIRGRGLEEGEKAHHDMESMAADYIREIKRIRPTGPYILGGACAGGYTAYEIARQLTAAGDKVLGVILIDPDVHPGTAPWFHWDDPNRLSIRAWRIVVRSWWAAKRRFALLRRRLQGKPQNRREPFETGVNRERQLEIRAGLTDALLAYRPGPYDGDIYMLCCAQSKSYLMNMRRGWASLARGVHYFVAGEEHEDLFHEALPSLAIALNKALNVMIDESVPTKNAAE